ncbi:hypothetical protein [Nonomuraea sp. B1E8]|uniref:hypothetical protein n=1 Tax=unclassified Nonomuraea TaxID=2593643 RepID=UPI00325E5A2F
MTYGPHQPPLPPQQPDFAPPPVVIDVGGDAKVRALIGGSVAGVIGLISIISAFTGRVEGAAGGPGHIRPEIPAKH